MFAVWKYFTLETPQQSKTAKCNVCKAVLIKLFVCDACLQFAVQKRKREISHAVPQHAQHDSPA